MRARGAPVIEAPGLVAIEPKAPIITTRGSKPVKSCGLTTQRTPKPKSKADRKPPTAGGYEWRKNGAGWDLRKVVYVEDATSGKQRKRPYLGHLSRSAFADMKKTNRGARFEKAIAQWIADHDH
jgi:hypothetical protein